MNHRVDENAPAELRALHVLLGTWRMSGGVDGDDGTRMKGAWHWPGAGCEFAAEKVG